MTDDAELREATEAEESHEVSGDPKHRVHVLVFTRDWERLGELYGSAVKRGYVVRMLLRDYLRRLEARAEEKL
jgi:hypothetical protein